MAKITSSIPFTSVNGFSFFGPPFEISQASPTRAVFVSETFPPFPKLTVILRGAGLDQTEEAPEAAEVTNLFARVSSGEETLIISDFDLTYPDYVDAYSLFRFASVIRAIARGDDTFRTSDAADVVRTYRGDDLVISNDGSDRVFGEAGDDTLIGGEGFDTLIGGAGEDRIIGGTGDDRLAGGGDADQLFGGAGRDLLQSGGGDDLVRSGGGSDFMRGGAGDDMLFGGGGADGIVGGKGDDSLIGGAGRDTLFGGDGADVLTGSGGRDVFVFREVSGDVVTDFKAGVDVIGLADTIGIADFEVLAQDHLQDAEEGLRIIDGDDLIAVLVDVTVADLTARDFLIE